MKDLIDSILLDTHGIVVPYSSNMQDAICLLSDVPSASISKYKLSVDSELFNTGTMFRVIFSFSPDIMENISIVPLQSRESPQKLYRKVQQKLSSILGPVTNVPEAALNFLNADFKNNIWSFSNIKVYHMLWEHFGLHGKISIDIY